ncbi:beta-galactosidase [Aestuariimicrobium kwangyangense]|uniref:beta-galactosidase n=1 Tax=Aestuariimicrobium kwangyangense TaxID=396389 RepID=UPI0003B6E0D8|nr:beta-galactosidase [Aestuariimicrobium kwangyangense]
MSMNQLDLQQGSASPAVANPTNPLAAMAGGALLFGGDYNPEQWEPSVWREDVALMVEAGVNIATVGVFSWSRLQPTADSWQVDWLDEVIDLLWSNGIAVDLATPTASPPPWMGLAHPEILSVSPEGRRSRHGGRAHFCPSSPVFRAACREVASRLGERYGDHPAVKLWHIGNEYGHGCWCDLCRSEFQAFLERRHGTIEALNHAWGTAFWSQHHASFDEVVLPLRGMNPGAVLDHRRFISSQLHRLYLDQREVLTPLVGGTPITTNLMGFYEHVDAQRWAPDLDVIADDEYPDPSDPQARSRVALVQDQLRSLRGGQPWLLMEQAMGAVNWRPHNVPKTSRQRIGDAVRAIGHGADGVLSFQWRQAASGSERFHSAMLPNSGPDTLLHRDVRRIGALLRELRPVAGTRVSTPLALVLDWESRWSAEEPDSPSNLRTVLEQAERWHRVLWERGWQVDVRAPWDDLSSYPVVLAPCAHLLDQDSVANLRAHVDAGGTLVMGPFSAVEDETARLFPGPFPGGFTDLLGARGEQWWPLPDAGVGLVSASLGDGRVDHWAERLVLDDQHPGEVVAAFDPADPAGVDLGPAVVKSPGHEFYYLGATLASEQLASLFGLVLGRKGLRPDLGVLATSPISEVSSVEVSGVEVPGVEIMVRGGHTFVVNHDADEIELTTTVPCLDLVSGEQGSTFRLVPQQAGVLRPLT